MARIANVSIPDNKRLVISLTYIYGIGLSTAQKILDQLRISQDIRVKDLTENQLTMLREYIDKMEVEGKLRQRMSMNIKRIREINCYRGLRIRQGLPRRGQRTKTNAQTAKKRKGR